AAMDFFRLAISNSVCARNDSRRVGTNGEWQTLAESAMRSHRGRDARLAAQHDLGRHGPALDSKLAKYSAGRFATLLRGDRPGGRTKRTRNWDRPSDAVPKYCGKLAKCIQFYGLSAFTGDTGRDISRTSTRTLSRQRAQHRAGGGNEPNWTRHLQDGKDESARASRHVPAEQPQQARHFF